MLAFAVVGPLIYFGPELRTIERGVVEVYHAIEGWILPVRDWLIG
jgi:hypothetical protein